MSANQQNQKTPAIEKILEAVPKAPAPVELDWQNGEIECDTVKLDKPYGYNLDDAIAVGSYVNNRHGISGQIDQIVWVSSRGYFRARLKCAGNPNKRVSAGEYRYIIISSGIGTTK